MQKLISKSDFAELAGVNPSTITRLCKTVLKNAVAGKRVDSAHADAVAYLETRVDSPVDLLYDSAIKLCTTSNRWTVSNIQRKLKIGYNRASTIADQMKAAGVWPGAGVVEDDVPPPPPPAPTTPSITTKAATPNPRGNAARRETKKRNANQEDQIYDMPEDIQAFADMTLRDVVEKFGTDVRFLDYLKAVKEIENINEKRLKNAETQGKLVSRELVKLGVIGPIDAAHIKLLTDGSKTIARRVTAMHDAGRPLGDVEKFIIDQITSFIRPVKSKIQRALKNI